LKIKTGLNVEQDIERVHKLSENFSGKLRIRVDANQGYNLQQLQHFIQATRVLDIELIEQPLPVGEEKQLILLPDAERKLLVADEVLLDAGSATELSQHPQPYGVFNIKLMKCGGIKGALEIANIAQHAGIHLFWGCNDESIISITAALHAALACANTHFLDLDGSFDIVETLVSGGFILEDGFLRPNGLPGLGVFKK
jgi:L-alanine-DL-glutamate epimerase-like enolase superfamily enzyme